MAISMVTGARDTNNILSNQKVIDMENTIHLLSPDETPLTSLIGGQSLKMKNDARPGDPNGLTLQTGSIYNPKAEWLEDTMAPRTDAVNFTTTYSTIATTIVVDNGAYFCTNQVIVNNNTKEVMRVTGISTNALTVTRNIQANASGFAIADNDEITILGDSAAEGDTSRTGKTTDKTALYNYSQIFRRPYEVTGTQNATKQYGGPDLDWQGRKEGIDHRRDIEFMMFLGARAQDTSGSHPLRHMGGLQYFVTDNVTDLNSTMAESDWLTWLGTIFDKKGGERYVFCSPSVFRAVSGFARGKLLTNIQDKKYGVTITQYVCPDGTVNLVRQPIFKGSTSMLGGYAVAVDMQSIQLAYMDQRATKLRTNIQANDADSQKNEYLTEGTLKVYNSAYHGILKRCLG